MADAKVGDQGARNWLAKYLLGGNPRTLLEIAAAEDHQWSAEDEIKYGPHRQIGSDLDDDLDDDWA